MFDRTKIVELSHRIVPGQEHFKLEVRVDDVTKIMPELTPPPPIPPTKLNVCTTSGWARTMSSALMSRASVSVMSEPTAVWMRTMARLWSCEGTNSLGSRVKTSRAPANRAAARIRTSPGLRRPLWRTRP